MLAFSIMINFSSCEQEDLDFYFDCDNCYDSIPVWDTLWVQLTINEENPFVPLTFYVGDIETGEKDWVDTSYTEEFWLTGLVDVEYSIKAEYKKGDQTIIAVDSDKIKAVDGSEECVPPCYYVRGGTLDVRLKTK